MSRKHYGRPSWKNWKRRQEYEKRKQRNYDKTFSDQKPTPRAHSIADMSPVQQAS